MVDVLLGYHLTNIEYFSNQYEKIRHATSVNRLKRYVRHKLVVTFLANQLLQITVSYKKNRSQQFVHVIPIKNTFPEDQTRYVCMYLHNM